ncbi:MAG: lipocalin family protein [Phenylobacterium sp.]|uniref:lipocalin family protein n=1 Tax=Phenylobacterium sp. TaxID=1871053 RepID=UPI001A36F3C6|nr:lipocalin family protein [Phenylobacterium sp.]MBL8773272.1 lipocalin family protein [Phenylobacterium sp.]
MPLSLTAGLFLAAAAAAAEPPSAGPIAPDTFYAGTWYEQARTPTSLTRGCEWATTKYSRDDRGRIAVKDACHDKRQDAPERSISGVGTIRDPGTNAALEVRYRLGPLRLSRTYRIIATDPDRSWFISSEPGFEKVYVFTREVAPPLDQVEALTARVRELGYKGELEILATPGRDKPAAARKP